MDILKRRARDPPEMGIIQRVKVSKCASATLCAPSAPIAPAFAGRRPPLVYPRNPHHNF
jgi:hypothetical protein